MRMTKSHELDNTDVKDSKEIHPGGAVYVSVCTETGAHQRPSSSTVCNSEKQQPMPMSTDIRKKWTATG